MKAKQFFFVCDSPLNLHLNNINKSLKLITFLEMRFDLQKH